MALQKGICKNFGECDLADSKEVQEVEKSNFVCEECGKPLFPLEGTKTTTTTTGGNSDKIKLIAIIAAILVVLAGAGYGIWSALSGTDEPKEIEVNQHEKTLNEGDTFQLEVMSLGDLKGKVQLEWSVTDGEDCISVDENGLVTAKREGRGTVNVCLAKKPELQDDCIIKVLRKVNDTVYIKEIKPAEVIMEVGNVIQLEAAVEPEGSISPIEWSSANSEIATVSSEGVVMGCAPGTTVVTAALHESKVTVMVSIAKATPKGVITKVSPSSATINVGKTKKLVATTEPADAQSVVTFVSSDESIATVASDGTVTGVKEGSTTITASLGDSNIAVAVTVNKSGGDGTGYVTNYKLPNGTYTGDMKNGKPHGHGTLKYSRREKVVPSANHYAEPGDTYEGDFRNGVPSAGGYLKHNGNTIFVN